MSSYYETIAGCLKWQDTVYSPSVKRAIYNGYTICRHTVACHAVKYLPEHFDEVWVGFGNADQELVTLLEKIDKGEL